MSSPTAVIGVVEDALGKALIECIIRHANPALTFELPIEPVGSVQRIRAQMPKFRGASRFVPHIVLVDLDATECAAALRSAWGLTDLPASLLFRIAVRESEAWLLADRHGFAAFAGVPVARLPLSPDEVADPKQRLLQLVRSSRKRRLVEELVPGPGRSAKVGPLYNERLGQFVRSDWDVARAAEHSPSLRRAIERLGRFP